MTSGFCKVYQTINHGECIVQNDTVLDLASDGDLYISLEVGIKVRVHSQIQGLASKVLSKMLKSRLKEGRLRLDTNLPPTMHLEDHDVNTMISFLRILHHQFDISSSSICDKESVMRLIILSDYYKCINALQPWIETLDRTFHCTITHSQCSMKSPWRTFCRNLIATPGRQASWLGTSN